MSLQGLDDSEARRRLEREGFNELPTAARRTPFRIAGEVLREPMFALLLGAGAIYLALGSLTEGVVLLIFASLSVLISIVQETRSERVLEALRTMTSPRALIVRNGERRRIPGREVARGDLVVLAEGDRVPADAMLLTATDLLADESLLTGESVAVAKRARRDPEDRPDSPGGDDLPTVYSGALIVRGQGVAEVFATGARAEIGKIGQALATIDPAPSRLAAQTRRLVRVFAAIGLAASLMTVIAYGLLRGSWLDASLAGIAIGMSMLPEEFPLVLTVFMVMGAWRISQVRVLTRRPAAIETLGAAMVLCTDKTGTLTENRMSVMALSADDTWMDWQGFIGNHPSPKVAHLLRIGAQASAPDAFDPMDRAIKAAAGSQVQDGSELIRSYGLTPELLAVTQVWRGAAGTPFVVAAKGAPEAIIGLCRLDKTASARVRATVDLMATKGVRVLAVANATHTPGPLPETPHAFAFSWVGLIGLADPLRSTVPDAIRQCRAAGIRVIMITGDYPATAQAIGRSAGLDHAAVVTGAEIAQLSDTALAERVKSVGIFARIMPEQKLRIVRALQSNGDVVAMTGDGVNDAPSLKAADIGISMGGRGTDVAREASSIVLLDDDFASIVRTIRLGRRIYDNLRKAMGYIIAVHLPIAGIALLPLLTGLPLVLYPLHIAFIEMIVDPVCSIAFEAEAEEDGLMERPPRAPGTELFSSAMIWWSAIQGLMAFGAVAGVYLLAALNELPPEDVRALAFFTLVLGNLTLILVNRSYRGAPFNFVGGRNRVLLGIFGLTGALLLLSVSWAPARHLFGFGYLHADDIGTIAGAIALLVVVLFSLRPLARRLIAV